MSDTEARANMDSCGSAERIFARLQQLVKRWHVAVRSALCPSHSEPVDADDIARIERYANGERRFGLIYIDPGEDSNWRARREQIEAALEKAMTVAGLPTRNAQELRLHGGRGQSLYMQCWRVPGPHGDRVLEELAGILAVARGLGLGQDTHVVAD